MFDSDGSKRHKKVACPLPNCSSSDAFAVYEDGGGHCYSCKGHVANVAKRFPETWAKSGWSTSGLPQEKQKNYMNNYYNPQAEARKKWDEAQTGFPIKARSISEQTVKELGIRLVVHGNKVVKHLYPLYDFHDEIVGFKERDVANKSFSVQYMEPSVPVQLHGMRLKPPGGKKIVIVEGELDLASCVDMFKQSPFHKNTAVVSIISGTDTAIKSFKQKANHEYVASFDKIILCLDNDKQGNKAKDDIASMFDPKKVYVATPGDWHDANDALMNGMAEDFINAISFPEKHRPKGVMSALDIMERSLNPKKVKSYDYPWKGLNDKTYGARPGELVAWLAQTKVGKTSVFENIQYHWLKKYPDEIKVANISLEKTPEETIRAILSLRVHTLLNHPEILPKVVDMDLEKVYKETFGENDKEQKFFVYDGWGSIDTDELVNTIRYYVKALGCNFVFFDHLSLAVSDQRNFDERKALDEITTKLAELVVETGVGLHVISHMNDFGQARGSRNIDKVSWIRIDLDRDKHHEDDDIRNTTIVTVVNNRPTGATGEACGLFWKGDKGGEMVEVPIPPREERDDTAKISDFEKFFRP